MARDPLDTVRLRRDAVWIAALAAGMALTLVPLRAEAQVAGPLQEFDTYLVATHFLRDKSYETHHYFKELRDGVLQGLVFRASERGAPLIEVEWAISGEVFARLPDWQKEYWHPLAPAVDAGRIRIPGLEPAREREMLQSTIRGLYAQTINLAGIDGGLPVGLEGVAMVTHITREEMMRWIAAMASR